VHDMRGGHHGAVRSEDQRREECESRNFH
jgi:hypothetical protein